MAGQMRITTLFIISATLTLLCNSTLAEIDTLNDAISSNIKGHPRLQERDAFGVESETVPKEVSRISV